MAVDESLWIPADLPGSVTPPEVPLSADGATQDYVLRLHSVLNRQQAQLSRVVKILDRFRIIMDADRPTASGSGVLWVDTANGKLYFDDPAADPPAWAGIGPSVFYALGNSTSNLGTSLGTVTWAAAAKSDAGFSEASGVITIGSDLDGEWARVDWAVGGDGATSRVTVDAELQVDPDGKSGYSAVKSTSIYSARDSTHNHGGVQGYHYLQLAEGMTIRVQAKRTGSTCNLVTNECSISIETKG
jgi:hypothetical protein